MTQILNQNLLNEAKAKFEGMDHPALVEEATSLLKRLDESMARENEMYLQLLHFDIEMKQNLSKVNLRQKRDLETASPEMRRYEKAIALEMIHRYNFTAEELFEGVADGRQ